MEKKDSRVPVQVLIEPEFRRKLKVLLAEREMTWGDLIIPHLEAFVHRRNDNLDPDLEN